MTHILYRTRGVAKVAAHALIHARAGGSQADVPLLARYSAHSTNTPLTTALRLYRRALELVDNKRLRLI